MNKKGIFFLILVISMLSLFVIIYTSYAVVNERKNINKRIETMNNFVFSLEEDLPRQIYISGYRAIFLFEKRITEKGSYISDINLMFEQAFFNGTIDGESQTIMTGAKFSDIQDSMRQKGDRINVNVTLYPHSVSITQDNPWSVKIILNTSMLIQDKGNLALWNRTKEIITYVPISNFEDPLYIINTNGRVSNKINKTVYSVFVSENNVSNLLSHLGNSYYIASASAPSFLGRLQGITSPNENGIESLVYLPELASQGISVKDKSCVDYIYFSSSNPSSHNIQGMPSWFKLDDNHLDIYQAGGLAI